LKDQRYACMTLDFEMDYGGRVQSCETLKEVHLHRKLREKLDRLGVPLCAFVQTSMLEEVSHACEVLKNLAVEFHSHSYTHDPENSPGRFGFEHSRRLLEKHFHQDRYGYRAPFGKLYPGDVELIQEAGYVFDASIFPSIRPGKFNHLRASIEPHRWHNGLLEIPFGVLPYLRLILGVSYMKLLGPNLYRALSTVTGLPRILVFYAHLHDWFPTGATRDFPPLLRMAFERNGNRGIDITEAWLTHLKDLGYTFVTMNQLVDILAEEGV